MSEQRIPDPSFFKDRFDILQITVTVTETIYSRTFSWLCFGMVSVTVTVISKIVFDWIFKCYSLFCFNLIEI